MAIIITLLISILVLNYAHEFGHFYAARRVGMKVSRMYVGVGPKITSWTDRHGTEFFLGLFPGAGAQIQDGEWEPAPAFDRLLVSSAGPASNFLCTFLLLAVAYVGFQAPAPALLDSVEVGGRGYEAGMRQDDLIVQVDGKAADTWSDVGLRMIDRVGDSGTVSFGIMRDGEPHRFELPINQWQSDVAWVDMFQYLGVTAAESDQGGSILAGVGGAVVDTVRMFWSTAMSGFQMVFGNMSVLNFVGGLQLTQLGIDGGNLDTGDYLKLCALFSLGIGIINLLPGPIVDGLAMLTAAAEWISRRRLSASVMKIVRPVGIILAFGPLPICLVHEILRISG